MKFSEMSFDQLEKFYNGNKYLQNYVADHALQCAQDSVDEYLNGIPNFCSYQIGSFCQGEHFKINGKRYQIELTEEEIKEFKSWLDEKQRTYDLLTIDEYNLACKWFEIALRFAIVSDELSDKDHYNMEKQRDELAKNLERILYDRLQSEFDWTLNDSDRLNYFFDMIPLIDDDFTPQNDGTMIETIIRR